MSILKELFGHGKRTKIPKIPRAQVPKEPRKPKRKPGTADVFDFREGLTAAVNGPSPKVAKYIVQPGTAAVEVYDTAGRLMAYDVFKATEPAPRGAWYPVKGKPATLVVPGQTSTPQQEFEFDFGDAHPITMPEHILAKREIGGRTIKVWWSCI